MGLANAKPPGWLVRFEKPRGIVIGIVGNFFLATPLAFWIDVDL
ncbi:MAG: hypothetical protein SGJ19_05245 [Planctomycetia bacterium]|nr:hypothetical protein [Planctomycetia bacterium]